MNTNLRSLGSVSPCAFIFLHFDKLPREFGQIRVRNYVCAVLADRVPLLPARPFVCTGVGAASGKGGVGLAKKGQILSPVRLPFVQCS